MTRARVPMEQAIEEMDEALRTRAVSDRVRALWAAVKEELRSRAEPKGDTER